MRLTLITPDQINKLERIKKLLINPPSTEALLQEAIDTLSRKYEWISQEVIDLEVEVVNAKV